MSPVELKNHVSRNGFDLSRKICFTAKFGQLLPLPPLGVFPGDKVKIRLNEFTRTLPVNTAAFARMRHYFDFYFVPYRLLWRDFPSFITSMANTAKQANAIDGNRSVGKEIPFFTSSQINVFLNEIEKSTTDTTNVDAFGFNRGKNARRLLQYLGYYHLGKPELDFGLDVASHNVMLSPFPLLAYQKIYNDYFRFTQWEEEQSNTYNIDYLTSGEQIPIETLLYGDKVHGLKSHEPNMFDIRYCNFNKDMFLGILPNRQFGATSTVEGSLNSREASLGSQFIFSMKNWDTATPTPTSGPIGIGSRGWDSQFKRMTSYDSESGKNNAMTLGSGSNYSPMIELGKKASINGSSVDNPLADGIKKAFYTTFDILALRAGEAVQKFREIAMSNGQDYRSQIEAHFGVKVSKIVSGMCEYIGGVSHDISVNEVVNQMFMNADGTSVPGSATLQGKGIASGNGYIDFDVKEHGLIMCMYHATVLPDYNVQGYERDVMRTTFSDFPLPEFDKLGFEPMPRVLLTGETGGIGIGDLPQGDGDNGTYIPFGYAPRYYDLKTSYDILLGGFNEYSGGTLVNWVTPISPKQILGTSASGGKYDKASYMSFKVNPHVVDPLFVAEADDKSDTDVLHVTSFFDIKAVRNFDRNGLPY